MKTRGRARKLIEDGHLRLDRQRVSKHACPVAPGQILTFVLGGEVQVVEILSLPLRRGPTDEARAHYRLLDENANQSHQPLDD